LAFQLSVVANGVLGGDPQLYVLSKAVMLLFFGIMALDILRKQGRMPVGRLLLLPLLFATYMIVSYAWAVNKTLHYHQMMTQLQLMLLLIFTYFVMRDGGTVKDYLKAVYTSGYCMILYALYKYGGLVAYIDAMEFGRMGGQIANENMFGMLFGSAAICAAYYMLVEKKWLHLVSVVLFAFFALSSGSKKAALMIVAGIFCISAIHFGIKKFYKTLLICAAALAIAWLVLQLPVFRVIQRRIEAMLTGNDTTGSDDARKHMIRTGFRMFLEKPILGYGLNNFRDFYVSGQYSHNNYTEVLVSGGLVGFVLYYGMYLVPLCKLFLGKHRKYVWKNRIYLMLLVWVAIDLVFGWGYVQVYEKAAHFLMGVLLATADNLADKAPEEKENLNEQLEGKNHEGAEKSPDGAAGAAARQVLGTAG
jgi:O-antigen ligase